ncbi:M20/M25/M40 family metallo-hydrolase [Candidatus Woesearchaeota archaeon]|nr:M20/M25/M40 family metallo-hydrolase [Candidatus Woesearchaeota archaeon]
MSSIDFLSKLVNAVSPSGDEENVRGIIKKAIKSHINKIEIDNFGNLICHKKGKGQTIILAAHMDEVGLMVNKVDDDGYLKISEIGGIDSIALVGQKVHILNNKNKVICHGIITFEEIHDGRPLDRKEIPPVSELYVDVGLTKKECKEKGIEVGNYIVPLHHLTILGSNNVISGKALDDRIGCYVLVELARKLKKSKANIYFIFTVQEEIGLYGAKTSVYNLEPDWGIAVDVVSAKDGAIGSTRMLGAGPVITIKDAEMIANRHLNNEIEKIAKKLKINLQKEVTSGGTTDATNIMLSKGGTPSTAIGVAVRNIHSTIGIADMRDINDIIKILYELLKNPPRTNLA